MSAIKIIKSKLEVSQPPSFELCQRSPLFPSLALTITVPVGAGQRQEASGKQASGACCACAISLHSVIQFFSHSSFCFYLVQHQGQPIICEGLVAREVDGRVRIYDEETNEEVFDIVRHQAHRMAYGV